MKSNSSLGEKPEALTGAGGAAEWAQMIPISTASFYGTYRPLQVVSLKILTPLKLNQIKASYIT